MRRAEQAMYLAKGLGRDRVISFGSAVPISDISSDPDRVNLLIRNANRATVEALAAAIDAKDPYSQGHSFRVAEYAVKIALKLGLASDEIEAIRLGGLVHDVGKVAVASSVLSKPGKLSVEEFREVQNHTVIGYEMVRGVEFLRKVSPVVLHHENMDGSGYPHGLSG